MSASHSWQRDAVKEGPKNADWKGDPQESFGHLPLQSLPLSETVGVNKGTGSTVWKLGPVR